MKKILGFAVLALACTIYAGTFRIEGEELTVQQGKVQIGQHAHSFSNGKVALTVAKETILIGSYNLDKAGKYHVWVRTFTQGGKWRNGELSINGQALGVFGDEPLKEGEKAHWQWIKLNSVELPAGKVEFKVFSKMGYVRLDALIITDEENYIPPAKAADVFKVQALPAAQ